MPKNNLKCVDWNYQMVDQKTVLIKKEKTKKLLKTVFGAVVIIALVCLTVYLFPLISKLGDAEVRERVRDFITDSGVSGVLIMLGIQLLQVILSVIPGEPVEVLFGFIYGPWLGAVLCLLSMALGSFLVFIATRALGRKFMDKTEQSGKFDKLKFLKNPSKRDMLIFILFFIPGTPKDTLTYFAPFTKIELCKFLLLSTIARIPSVISSTFAGESIFTGDYLSTILIFAITGAIGILGIVIYNYILKKHAEKSDSKDSSDDTN